MNTKIFISMPEKFEVVPFYREEEYEIWLKKRNGESGFWILCLW